MNPIRRWQEERDARRRAALARRQAEMDELVARLNPLIARFQDRLSPNALAFIAEQPDYAEPELAIDMLWENVDSGVLAISKAERAELLELTAHPGVALAALSHGRTHLSSRDIDTH